MDKNIVIKMYLRIVSKDFPEANEVEALENLEACIMPLVEPEVNVRFYHSHKKKFCAVNIEIELDEAEHQRDSNYELIEYYVNQLFLSLENIQDILLALSYKINPFFQFSVNTNAYHSGQRPIFYLSAKNIQLLGQLNCSLELDGYLYFGENEPYLAACRALSENNLQQLKQLVERYGVNNLYDDNKWDPTPLFLAVKYQKIWALEYLLSKNIYIEVTDLFGDTAFDIAAKYSNVEVMELFCRYYVNINRQGKEGFTPLHYALYFKNYDVAVFLIQKGAAINVPDVSARTAVDYIKACGNEDLLAVLNKKLEQ